MLSWNQITSETVVTSHPNVLCLNQVLLDEMNKFPIGFYVWTTQLYFEKKIVKIGQTQFGVRRPKEVLGNSTGIVGDIYILAWFPSEKATEKNYDQRVIHPHLNKNKNFKWLKDHSAGKEFQELQKDATLEELYESIYQVLGNNLTRDNVQQTIWQNEIVNAIGNDLVNGKKTILAELSARFGKTIAFLLLFLQYDVPVMVVATYFNSALFSFLKEVSRYYEFENFVTLRINDLEFKEKFTECIANGKKIVVLQSLHQSKIGFENSVFLSDFHEKIVVVDEADFGAHTPKQRSLIDLTSNGCPLILATGTGSDIAATGRKIDSFHSITYPDMLMMSRTDYELSTAST